MGTLGYIQYISYHAGSFMFSRGSYSQFLMTFMCTMQN